MKVVSDEFIEQLKKEAGSTPVVRPFVYKKYPGIIRTIGGTSVVAGTTCTSVNVYGNASRFFTANDNVIIKTLPLSGIGVIMNTPVFDGTTTELCISNLAITDDNIGGFVLRDINFKFNVGSTL